MENELIEEMMGDTIVKTIKFTQEIMKLVESKKETHENVMGAIHTTAGVRAAVMVMLSISLPPDFDDFDHITRQFAHQAAKMIIEDSKVSEDRKKQVMKRFDKLFGEKENENAKTI